MSVGTIEIESLFGRYYDPSTDQFLSVDPDVAETGQPYAYTGDDPVNGTDPLGDIFEADGYSGGSLQELGTEVTAAEAAATVSGAGGTPSGPASTPYESLQSGPSPASQAPITVPLLPQSGGEPSISDVLLGLGMVAPGFDDGPDEALIGADAADGALASGQSIEAADGTEINGLTRHGINRVIGDGAGRAGVTPQALLDALKNPVNIIEGVDDLGRPYKIYIGQDARVVINPETGNIVSVNPLSGAGANK
jgi:hypothetical protein